MKAATAELSEETARFVAELTGDPPRQPALWLEALTHGSMGEPANYERLTVTNTTDRDLNPIAQDVRKSCGACHLDAGLAGRRAQ